MKPGSKLERVLGNIEGHAGDGFDNGDDALAGVAQGARDAGLDPGVLTGQTEDGGYELTNKGGVVTTVSGKGRITVQKGDDVVLDIPSKGGE